MLIWTALTMVVMFTAISMIHNSRDSKTLSSQIFFSLFSLVLSIGYTLFCFKNGNIFGYILGTSFATPMALKLDKNKD